MVEVRTETFAETLRNRVDLAKVNNLLLSTRALKILEHYDKEGHLENNEWKVSGWDGGYGGSLCFNISTGVYKDFGDQSRGGHGIVGYLSRRWKQSVEVVVEKLVEDNLLVLKEAYGTSRRSKKTDHGSLIVPVPEDEDLQATLKPSILPLIKGQWAYRDTDGSLLGYVIRLEEPGGKKKTPPYTFWSVGGWQRTDWGGSWPLFGLEQLALKGKGAKVILVEGEKTATIAQELLPGCVVLGFGGVNKVDKLELKFLENILIDRDIIIWPDNDRVGVKAGKKLAWRLIKELGCRKVKRVLVESIKEIEAQEGWDLGDYDPNMTMRPMVEIESAEDQNGIDALVKNYVYVGRLKRFFSSSPTSDNSFGYDKESFRDMHSHIQPKLDAELLCDSRLTKLDTITFWPGMDRTVIEDSQMKLNTWSPDGFIAELEDINFAEQGIVWDSELAKEKTAKFREHTDFIFPDPFAKGVFLSYLKYLLEEPGEKVLWAPLIQGEEGTGKSYFGDFLREMMGIRNVSVVQNEQIKGDYTGWMANTTVAIIEELSSGGKREFTDKMKPLITNKTVQIREKYMPDTEIRNRVNFLMFTNRKDALIIDDNDRRFFVYYSPAVRKEAKYYQELFEELYENTWWLYHYLLYEVSYVEGINFKGTAPHSASKIEMTKQSKREIDAELEDLAELETSYFFKDVLSVEQIMEVLAEKGYKSYSSQAVGKAMSRVGWEVLGQQKWGMNNTKKIRLIAVRNQKKWLSASVDDIKVEYDRVEFVDPTNIVEMKMRSNFP